jgi:hypothetical protein
LTIITVNGDGVEVGELTVSYHVKKERERRRGFWRRIMERAIKSE